jgi:hypothetical protein
MVLDGPKAPIVTPTTLCRHQTASEQSFAVGNAGRRIALTRSRRQRRSEELQLKTFVNDLA